jgi:hypothetical protein
MLLSTLSGGHLSLQQLVLCPLIERFAETHADVLRTFRRQCLLIVENWLFPSSRMVQRLPDLRFQQQAKASDLRPSQQAAQA